MERGWFGDVPPEMTKVLISRERCTPQLPGLSGTVRFRQGRAVASERGRSAQGKGDGLLPRRRSGSWPAPGRLPITDEVTLRAGMEDEAAVSRGHTALGEVARLERGGPSRVKHNRGGLPYGRFRGRISFLRSAKPTG